MWRSAPFTRGVTDERASSPTRNPADSGRRNKDWNGSSPSAWRAESTVLGAELVRRVVPEPRSQYRDHETRASGRVAGAMVGVHEEVQVRDGRARGQARPG